jgi:thioredoxin-related protein
MAASLAISFLFLFLLYCDRFLQQLDLFDFVRDYIYVHTAFLTLIMRKQAKYLWEMKNENRKKAQTENLTPVHVYIHNQTRRRATSSEQKPVL